MTDDPQPATAALLEQLQAMPKIDLHRHLEGSLRLETLAEIARDYKLDLPHDPAGLRPLVEMVDGRQSGLRNFLDKFAVLRRFYRSEAIITRLTREVIDDCAADNIRYLELRFTPSALADVGKFRLEDVTDWVIQSANEAAAASGVRVRFILSMNRHEPVTVGERVARIVVGRQSQGVVGIDLAGNEATFPGTPFEAIFRDARVAGLKTTVHAGEWAGADSVREAIEVLGAERLGHGVRAARDADVLEMARERDIAFELCVTSNVQTGAVKSIESHPLRQMYDQTLLTTLNTDDPSICGVTLSSEMAVAVREFGFTFADLKAQTLTAARVAFLPAEEREALVREFAENADS